MDTVITILGPTATGKTQIATKLASEMNGEIISADSRQVFRKMDIGTGKDLDEYLIGGVKIPYHLIDIKNPGEEYSLFEFLRDYKEAYKSIQSRGKQTIVCGGSTLYLEALLQNYEMIKVPENFELPASYKFKDHEELVKELKEISSLHNHTDLIDPKRTLKALRIAKYTIENQDKKIHLPKVQHLVFGIELSRAEIKSRITKRLKERLQNGMIEEAESLIKSGLHYEDLKYYGLEYKYLALYLEGKINRNDLFQKLNSAIHEFAKKQMTRYRKMEKQGVSIHWIDGQLGLEEKLKLINNKFETLCC